MKRIKAAAVQFEHASGDKRANLDTIAGFVERAHTASVDLIIFPECCVTGYWFLRNLTRSELEDLSEPVPGGPTSLELSQLARERGMTIGAGLVELGDDGELYLSLIHI